MTDRPLGPLVVGWTQSLWPRDLHLAGHWADLRPLDPARDAPGLWRVFAGHDSVWDYLGSTPPADAAELRGLLEHLAALDRSPCLVIRARGDDAPLGYACFWTIAPDHGCIEIGNVNLSPALQRTRIATEAFSQMIGWAFGPGGYRRVEWKCNALNAPSRAAATRLGFRFEGIFRKHLVVKGRSRDTAWYAMTDDDWQDGIRDAHATWLSPANFDAQGQQKLSLRNISATSADPPSDRSGGGDPGLHQ